MFISLFLGTILLLASVGVLVARKPVYAALSFLVVLLVLAALYLQLSAEFIAVMQVLVYAGAILVLFIFVIMLFQDAQAELKKYSPQSSRLFLTLAAVAFLLALVFVGVRLADLGTIPAQIPPDYGTVHSLGKALYIDTFFPFEAVILIFLVSLIGAVYIGRKER